MKKTFFPLIVLIGLGSILSSCEKEDKVTFSISEADAISHNSATFHVSVEANNTITNRGICYSSKINTPTTENSKVSAGNGTGGFYVMLINLIKNTVYYARPYAIANGVTYYGDVKMFKTLQNINEPNFTISEAFDISHNSATFNASVSANTTITDRGVCYSSQINPPTTKNFKISAGSGAGSFSAILIDLIENTVYYVRPYAVVNDTVYYGEVKDFKTGLFINPLTLTISEASNIFHNSATFNASVSANTTITDKGICYSSQNAQPRMTDNTITFGAGIGSFSVTLTNLIENTPYYVCLYAILANGELYYGDVKSFKTMLPPILTISEAINISHKSATFNASVVANTTITEKGVCYSSQNPMPTTDDSKISEGSGPGSFSVTLTNLIENTPYYVRLYTILANGTVCYGEVKNFKTGLFHGESVLINGVRWATRNVNKPHTFAANPEDAGMFYQWNREIGWSNKDPMINSNGGTTWDSSIPNGHTYYNNPCPSGYRVPTYAEFQTLLNTNYVRTTENGVTGILFSDKNNGNSIFLPIAGYRHSSDGTFDPGLGGEGYYWSSTEDYNLFAHAMLLYYDPYLEDYHNKANGYSVRPVVE